VRRVPILGGIGIRYPYPSALNNFFPLLQDHEQLRPSAGKPVGTPRGLGKVGRGRSGTLPVSSQVLQMDPSVPWPLEPLQEVTRHMQGLQGGVARGALIR
jgi:hypothetical protein